MTSGLLTTWHQSAGLWYFVTNIMYQIFGVSYISARILSLVVGTLTILAIYLLTKELFRDEKVGIIAATIFTFYSGHIKLTEAFMHTTLLFFFIMCLYYLLKAERTGLMKYYIIGFGYIAIAQLLKSYVIVFVPGLVLFLFANRSWVQKKPFTLKDKQLWKIIGIFALIMLIAGSPILVYNYLLYKDKGIVDRQFTTVFGLQNPMADQLYSWDGGYDDKFEITRLFSNGGFENTPDLITLFGNLIALDIFITIAFFIALFYCIFCLRDNEYVRRYLMIFVWFMIPPMIYLNSMLILTKHMLYFPALFIPLIAFIFFRKWANVNMKQVYAVLVAVLLCLLFFFGLSITFKIHENFFYKMDRASLYSFGMGVDKNSLIIQDPRAYPGYIMVAFPYNPVINLQDVIPVMDMNINFTDKVPYDIYFIEQVNNGVDKIPIDDYFAQLQSNNVELVATMSDKNLKPHCINKPFKMGCWYYYNPLFEELVDGETPVYRVYKTKTMLSKTLTKQLLDNRYFFLHFVGYGKVDPNFSYTIHSKFDEVLNGYAFTIMGIGIFFYFLLILNVFLEVMKNDNINPLPAM
jgi:hypothetical protein